MDNLSNKALLIGASLLVTIIITTAVIGIIGQIQEVYAQVYTTDVSLRNQFGEYDMYNNSKKIGVDLKNAVNKYLNDPRVTITAYNFGNIKLNTTENIYRLNNVFDNTKYLTTLTLVEKTGFVVINFSRR